MHFIRQCCHPGMFGIAGPHRSSGCCGDQHTSDRPKSRLKLSSSYRSLQVKQFGVNCAQRDAARLLLTSLPVPHAGILRCCRRSIPDNNRYRLYCARRKVHLLQSATCRLFSLLPRLCWIAHERRRDLARFDGSRDRASMMFQPCFLAVETKERISAKSIAPCNDRKPPEIFCRSFIMRPSRSA